MKVLILTADGFEDSELLVPLRRLREEGAVVEIASLAPGPLVGKHGHAVEATLGVDDVRAAEYDALVVPGGRAPEALRRSARALDVVRAFFAARRTVAAICHGPALLASAGVLRDRAATGYRTVVRELEAAGARYRDAEVVVDGNLVTSRQPSDLPAFVREIVQKLRERESVGRAG